MFGLWTHLTHPITLWQHALFDRIFNFSLSRALFFRPTFIEWYKSLGLINGHTSCTRLTFTRSCIRLRITQTPTCISLIRAAACGAALQTLGALATRHKHNVFQSCSAISSLTRHSNPGIVIGPLTASLYDAAADIHVSPASDSVNHFRYHSLGFSTTLEGPGYISYHSIDCSRPDRAGRRYL